MQACFSPQVHVKDRLIGLIIIVIDWLYVSMHNEVIVGIKEVAMDWLDDTAQTSNQVRVSKLTNTYIGQSPDTGSRLVYEVPV